MSVRCGRNVNRILIVDLSGTNKDDFFVYEEASGGGGRRFGAFFLRAKRVRPNRPGGTAPLRAVLPARVRAKLPRLRGVGGRCRELFPVGACRGSDSA